MDSTQPPYKPTESELAEREEVKAQLLAVLKEVDRLEARLAELEAMPVQLKPVGTLSH